MSIKPIAPKSLSPRRTTKMTLGLVAMVLAVIMSTFAMIMIGVAVVITIVGHDLNTLVLVRVMSELEAQKEGQRRLPLPPEPQWLIRFQGEASRIGAIKPT